MSRNHLFHTAPHRNNYILKDGVLCDLSDINHIKEQSFGGLGTLIDHFQSEPLKIQYRIYPLRSTQWEKHVSNFHWDFNELDTNDRYAFCQLDKAGLLHIVEAIYQVHCQDLEQIDIPMEQHLVTPCETKGVQNSFIRVYGLRAGLPCTIVQFHGEVLHDNCHKKGFQSLHFTLSGILEDALHCQKVQGSKMNARPAIAGLYGLKNKAIQNVPCITNAHPEFSPSMPRSIFVVELDKRQSMLSELRSMSQKAENKQRELREPMASIDNFEER